MKDIRLYIANKLVDCTDGISLPITYQLEDFSNPTLVKNSFSKTIAIPGTKNNNKIFGEIYKLDRMQHYEEWTGNPELNGINFDPSKRVEFQIYKDADLVESGYMQLNDISIQENNVTYNITLYGGIGDFFYGLKYKEDGTAKSLADIRYFIEDDQGNVLDESEEMNFEVNKDLIYEAYTKDYTQEGNELLDTITFIPSYNGIYDDFDSSKCLINTNEISTEVFPTSKEEDGTTYTTLNGFGLASLEKDCTEWETRDLRSYYQRPAIKVSKLIESICREENSGYNVTYDETFFNDHNPYWSKTFVALPLLTSNENITDEDIGELTNISQFNTESYQFAQITPSTSRNGALGRIIADIPNTTVDENGVITVTDWNESTRLNLSVSYRMWCHLNSLPRQNPGSDEMFFSIGRIGGSGFFMYRQVYSNYLAIIDVETGQAAGWSQVEQIDDHYWGQYTPAIQPFDGATVVRRSGRLKKAATGNTDYYFQTDNSNENEFTLKIANCKVPRRFSIFLITRINIASSNPALVSDEKYYVSSSWGFNNNAMTDYWGENVITAGVAKLTNYESYGNSLNFEKRTVLKTDKTPADFLLDYTKLFGLYFIKDRYEKTIHICTRNTFFNGVMNNWDKRIDYSKDMTVTPILFDKKYYLMQLDTPETKDALKYKSQYTQQYGQQRLSTGYNFNYDSDNFYDENIYQQIVPTIDSDRLFRNFYDSQGNPVPSWLVDNASYELFNGTESTSIDLYGRNLIDSSRTVEWNGKGADFWAKSSFFSLDSDDKNLVEIESALLMWNGIHPLVASDGSTVPFWITDNIPEMDELNDGDPCYIYTESEYDADDNRIARRITALPKYINCTIDQWNNVAYSLDFGLPKEIYMGNVNYTEDATIYANFWKKFYNDQFNIDTKKVTCFVKLDNMNQDFLREFYFFDNAIWVLNKVDSYDVNSDATVRCEFIKVQDVNNYTNGVTTF